MMFGFNKNESGDKLLTERMGLTGYWNILVDISKTLQQLIPGKLHAANGSQNTYPLPGYLTAQMTFGSNLIGAHFNPELIDLTGISGEKLEKVVSLLESAKKAHEDWGIVHKGLAEQGLHLTTTPARHYKHESGLLVGWHPIPFGDHFGISPGTGMILCNYNVNVTGGPKFAVRWGGKVHEGVLEEILTTALPTSVKLELVLSFGLQPRVIKLANAREGDAAVRVEALRLVGLFDTIYPRELVRQLINKPKEVARFLVAELGKDNSAKEPSSVLSHLGADIVGELGPLVKHRDREVRRLAARILSDMNSRSAVGFLRTLAGDSDNEIAMLATIGLLPLQANTSIEPLYKYGEECNREKKPYDMMFLASLDSILQRKAFSEVEQLLSSIFSAPKGVVPPECVTPLIERLIESSDTSASLFGVKLAIERLADYPDLYSGPLIKLGERIGQLNDDICFEYLRGLLVQFRVNNNVAYQIGENALNRLRALSRRSREARDKAERIEGRLLNSDDVKEHVKELKSLREKHGITVISRLPANFLKQLKKPNPEPGQPVCRIVMAEADHNGALMSLSGVIEALIEDKCYVDLRIFSNGEEALGALKDPLRDTAGGNAPIGGLIVAGHGSDDGTVMSAGFLNEALYAKDMIGPAEDKVYVKNLNVIVWGCSMGAGRGENPNNIANKLKGLFNKDVRIDAPTGSTTCPRVGIGVPPPTKGKTNTEPILFEVEWSDFGRAGPENHRADNGTSWPRQVDLLFLPGFRVQRGGRGALV